MKTRSGIAGLALGVLLAAACGRAPADVVRDFGSKDRETVDRAVETMRRRGDDGLPALVEGLRSEDPQIARASAWTLRGMDASAAVPALAEAFERGHGRARAWAAYVLWDYDRERATRLPSIAEGLRDPDDSLRQALTQDLAHRPDLAGLPPLPALLEGLGVCLHDENDAVRTWAAAALGRMGRPAVAILVGGLDDPRSDWWAIKALRSIGPAAVDAVPALERIASGEEPQRAFEAKTALGSIRGK